jgi:excinuclease ABC subunit C
MNLEEKITSLPTTSGVYLMKGRRGIIYIGKAANLRSRVRSYFRKSGDTRYAARFLASKVVDVEFILTTNEKEALILEETLLKKHRPRYNIRLKDDKTYVSIKMTMNEDFPRILVTRRVIKDGSRYFGPYASSGMVRDTIKFIRRIFPLCVCSVHEFRNRVRPCLDYQMGICSSPGAGKITKEDYAHIVEGAVLFLEGKNRDLLKMLKSDMQKASNAHCFEEAAKLRDRLRAVEETLKEQKVVTNSQMDRDVFALSAKEDGDFESLSIVVLFIRDGRLVATKDFFISPSVLPRADVMSSLLRQFYTGARYIPDEILLPIKLRDSALLSDWLSDKRGKKVSIKRPEKGPKARLVKMAEGNSAEALRRELLSAENPVIKELQSRLKLKRLPKRIEAFDISNLGGTNIVGAMVSFSDGTPEKHLYRKYKIRSVDGPNDYASMYELLSRRYKQSEGVKGIPVPDLILLDGGKGQLNIARRVMKELAIDGSELVSLAKDSSSLKKKTGDEEKNKPEKKQGEKVYLVGRKDPIIMREGTRPDLLLRRIRDEVHRFVIGYHRGLRSKSIGSVLDGVRGVGRVKRKRLFDEFGDLKGIKSASIEDLLKVSGITKELALAVKKRLKEK